MPQTRDCDYCGAEIEPGTGTMLVHVNGSVTHFCSAKCEKNADLGREPRDLEWTEEGGDYGAEAEEEAAEAEEEPEAEEVEEAPEAEESEEAEAEADESEEADSEAEEAEVDESEAAAEDDEETEE